MSVSLKIVNVSVSHKIVIYRVILRGLDRGGRTIVCDGPYWCLADYMLRNIYKTLSNTAKKRHNENKKYFVTYRHFLSDLQTLSIFFLNCPYFYLIQFKHIFVFALSVNFMHKSCHLERKNRMICFFCRYSDFSGAPRSCGRKNVCKSRK